MIRKHTPNKYLFILMILIVTTICSLVGCGGSKESEQQEEQEENPLLNKVYRGNYTPDLEEIDAIKFYDDNTLQGLEIRGIGDFMSYYGTYEIDNRAITMHIADKSYSGAIIDNGASIKFGKNEYLDRTERLTNNNDSILKEFDQ